MNDDRNDSKFIFGQFTFCTFLIRIQFLFYKKIALRQDGKMRYKKERVYHVDIPSLIKCYTVSATLVC